MTRTLSLLLMAGWLALPTTPADAAKREPCPDGGYVVLDRSLLPGDGASDLITITGRDVSLASGCETRRGRVKGTKTGTKVRVKWKTCGEQRKVLLKGLIDEACATLSGTIKFKGSDGPQDFSATEMSLVSTSTTTTPGSSTTSTTMFTGQCTPLSLDNVKAAVAAGGIYQFCESGAVSLDDTLVVDGAVTLLAPLTDDGRGIVSYRREFGPDSFRLFEVHGSLTLDGAVLYNGQDLGQPGSSGADVVENGMEGARGTPHMMQATNGGTGGSGKAGLQPGSAGHGGPGRGGAMMINGGGSVVLRNCLVEGNTAVGGRGGNAGDALRAGLGGLGGDGGVGMAVNAGNGGTGGQPGVPRDGRSGGNGGNGEGGAIHNGGTLTVEACTFRGNFATGGLGGDGGWGGSGGGGGSGGRGGEALPTNPSGQPYNGKKGGDGGKGTIGADGKNGGRGGNGGSATGGAIHSAGSLTLVDVTFQGNGATGVDSGNGASGGAGGSGGGGGVGGAGNPCGKGGNGADGANGGAGGSNGNGGSGRGGAIFSTGAPTLVGVEFVRNGATPTNTVGGGSGGVNNCVPGSFGCFGDGGLAGLGGNGAFGGQACFAGGLPGGPPGAMGTKGNDGSAGAVGTPGAPGGAVGPECFAGGASCAP